MLAGGYVSRYSVDGAGLIAAIVFAGFAIFNNASITAGGMVIDMFMTAGAIFVAVLAVIALRYI